MPVDNQKSTSNVFCIVFSLASPTAGAILEKWVLPQKQKARERKLPDFLQIIHLAEKWRCNR